MKLKLIDLLAPYEAVSIIGMAKNVGKTTTMNAIIGQFDQAGIALGLTSIGRDGESVDVVTGTDKPEIYVRKGTLIATAADLLKLCDISKEICYTTGIYTPMGEVVIVRALSDGYVQLGGASINSQIATVCAQLKALGGKKMLVDGAISRKTMASPVITDATVLCTGASLNTNMETVLEETAHTVNMLMLPQASPDLLARLQAEAPPEEKAVRLLADGTMKPMNLMQHEGKPEGETAGIFIRGAMSDAQMDKLIMSNMVLKGVTLVVEDASKIFLKPATYQKLLRSGATLEVQSKINVVALSINPVSAYGNHFDKQVFMDAMCQKVGIPVYNAVEDF